MYFKRSVAEILYYSKRASVIQKLVIIAESSWGSIPVVISMNFDYKELAHYLYSLTPQQDLEPEKGHHIGASLVSFAIYTLILGKNFLSNLIIHRIML